METYLVLDRATLGGGLVGPNCVRPRGERGRTSLAVPSNAEGPRVRRDRASGRRRGCMGACPEGVERDAPQAEPRSAPIINLENTRYRGSAPVLTFVD
jgi:hypothetical protein